MLRTTRVAHHLCDLTESASRSGHDPSTTRTSVPTDNQPPLSRALPGLRLPIQHVAKNAVLSVLRKNRRLLQQQHAVHVDLRHQLLPFQVCRWTRDQVQHLINTLAAIQTSFDSHPSLRLTCAKALIRLMPTQTDQALVGQRALRAADMCQEALRLLIQQHDGRIPEQKMRTFCRILRHWMSELSPRERVFSLNDVKYPRAWLEAQLANPTGLSGLTLGMNWSNVYELDPKSKTPNGTDVTLGVGLNGRHQTRSGFRLLEPFNRFWRNSRLSG